MNDFERRQLDSAELTFDYLQKSDIQPIWQGLDAFAEGVDKIAGSLNILHTLGAQRSGTTTGITVDKDRVRQSVVRRTIAAAGALKVLGTRTGNAELVSNATVSKRELAKATPKDLRDSAQAIYDLGIATRSADRVEAAKVGLKPDPDDTLLSPLMSAITAFNTIAHAPTAAIKSRATMTEAISAELRRMQRVFKDELDPLMPQFEDAQPTFIADYGRNRAQVTQHKKDGGKQDKKSGGDAPTSGGGA